MTYPTSVEGTEVVPKCRKGSGSILIAHAIMHLLRDALSEAVLKMLTSTIVLKTKLGAFLSWFWDVVANRPFVAEAWYGREVRRELRLVRCWLAWNLIMLAWGWNEGEIPGCAFEGSGMIRLHS